MAFNYVTPPSDASTTTTVGSKAVLAKSAIIDFAAGSGGAHNTAYKVGITLPKGAQIFALHVHTATVVSGGTISAATLAISATNSIVSGINVFSATNVSWGPSTGGYSNNLATNINKDYELFYTLTLTGTGPATAGKIYVTALYVV